MLLCNVKNDKCFVNTALVCIHCRPWIAIQLFKLPFSEVSELYISNDSHFNIQVL